MSHSLMKSRPISIVQPDLLSFPSCMRRFVAAVLLLCGTAVAADEGKADPILGKWRWSEGNILECRADQTFVIFKSMDVKKKVSGGSWKNDPFAPAARGYRMAWEGEKSAFDMTMATDGSMLKGMTGKGKEILALKLSDYTVYLLADDMATFRVNGASVIASRTIEARTAKVSLRSGDVLSVAVWDKQGGKGGSFAFLMLDGNRTVVTCRDFKYTLAPDPDWETGADLFGYRMPQMTTLEKPLGNVERPPNAWVQAQDKRSEKVYFKYVMP